MQDLGHLLPSQPLIGNSSMAASNTVSDETGSGTAAGSESEQTAGVKVGIPVVPMPPRETHRPVMVGDSAFSPTAISWKDTP